MSFEALVQAFRNLITQNLNAVTGIGRDALIYLERLQRLYSTLETNHRNNINSLQAQEEKHSELVEAVRWIYYAARWTPDRSLDSKEGNMWARLRDAAGFEKGKSPKPVTGSFTSKGVRESPTSLGLLFRKSEEQIKSLESAWREQSIENSRLKALIEAYKVTADLNANLINEQSIKITDLDKKVAYWMGQYEQLKEEHRKLQKRNDDNLAKIAGVKGVLNG